MNSLSDCNFVIKWSESVISKNKPDMIHKTSCRNLYSIERTASHIFSLLFVLFFLGGEGGGASQAI